VMKDAVGYDLYDFTSSSLNRSEGAPVDRKGAILPPERNDYRISPLVYENNFGVVDIDWTGKNPGVAFEIRDTWGGVLYRHEVPFSRLKARKPAAPRRR